MNKNGFNHTKIKALEKRVAETLAHRSHSELADRSNRLSASKDGAGVPIPVDPTQVEVNPLRKPPA